MSESKKGRMGKRKTWDLQKKKIWFIVVWISTTRDVDRDLPKNRDCPGRCMEALISLQLRGIIQESTKNCYVRGAGAVKKHSLFFYRGKIHGKVFGNRGVTGKSENH